MKRPGASLKFGVGGSLLGAFAMAVGLMMSSAAPRAQEAKPTTDAPAGNAENGRKLFKTVGCYQCHGYTGQGGSGSGPRIGPPILTFPAFSAYTRQPKAQMPPYTAKVLSEAQMADIYAFLQARPKPPDAKSLPLLTN